MQHLAIVLPLSAVLWFFAVVVLAGSISVVALCAARLVWALWIRDWQQVLGALLAAPIWGLFGVMVGWYSFALGAEVINGLIGRLV